MRRRVQGRGLLVARDAQIVCLSSRLDTYQGENALRSLRRFGEMRLNPGKDDIDSAWLATLADSCEIAVSYRRTPFDAAYLTEPYRCYEPLCAACRSPRRLG